MRLCEALIICLSLATALHTLWTGRNSMLFPYCILTLVVVATHLVLEGAHWQMGPAYLAALALATLTFGGPAQRVIAAVAMGLALCSCGLAIILPVFRLPAPTGTFAIGTRILHLVDRSRVEVSGNVARPRELMVQIWYPAEQSRNPLAPYRIRAETTLISSYQSVTWTHSRTDAPVAKLQPALPVLLFNPAWTGRRTQNTFLGEDLASHGYAVVAIDHPGNSGPTAFPDGHVGQPPAVNGMDLSANSLETVDATAEAELERQTADNIFVLDQLQTMNSDPQNEFYQRLNTHVAGAFGHSFGGAVAAQACYLDSRIRSALDLDGSLFGRVSREGLKKPFMFISQDVNHYSEDQMKGLDHAMRISAMLDQRDFSTFQRSTGYRLYLHGSNHISFTDGSLFSPCKRLVDAGAIPPARQFRILREYALAFFDKTLRNSNPGLLSVPSPFPEVSFSARMGGWGD